MASNHSTVYATTRQSAQPVSSSYALAGQSSYWDVCCLH
jgi:hypothetical protein